MNLGAAIALSQYHPAADHTHRLRIPTVGPSVDLVEKSEHEAVLERTPRRLDDVRADADRRPITTTVGGRQQHARGRARGAVPVEDAHLVVDQLEPVDLRVRALSAPDLPFQDDQPSDWQQELTPSYDRKYL